MKNSHFIVNKLKMKYLQNNIFSTKKIDYKLNFSQQKEYYTMQLTKILKKIIFFDYI